MFVQNLEAKKVIDEVKGMLEVLLRDLSKVCPFGEKLAQQAIAIFIRTPLPRGIRVGKVDA
ncbi:UNVERIFIED_CONTAM: hypothetical protein ABIC26_000837 [Paenibacillus sp. PvR008]